MSNNIKFVTEKKNKFLTTKEYYGYGQLRELPVSKEAGFRRRQHKDTGFEPAGSLFSCLSG